MRVPLSWLRTYAAVPESLPSKEISDALIRVGLEVETVDPTGADVTGPLVIGRVEEFVEETHSNGKTVRWCRVDVGAFNEGGRATDFDGPGRGIICGAANFAVGDLVVVALPGTVLPGGFEIASRKTYGHYSDGMICSARELGVGDDHDGIIVLTPDGTGPRDPLIFEAGTGALMMWCSISFCSAGLSAIRASSLPGGRAANAALVGAKTVMLGRL